MTHELRVTFETFLVEDVILTLGNLRSSLAWLGTANGMSAAEQKAGLERLGHQIELLDQRAREVCSEMRRDQGSQDNIFDFLKDAERDPAVVKDAFHSTRLTVDTVLQDACLDDPDAAMPPTFRSFRGGGG